MFPPLSSKHSFNARLSTENVGQWDVTLDAPQGQILVDSGQRHVATERRVDLRQSLSPVNRHSPTQSETRTLCRTSTLSYGDSVQKGIILIGKILLKERFKLWLQALLYERTIPDLDLFPDELWPYQAIGSMFYVCTFARAVWRLYSVKSKKI